MAIETIVLTPAEICFCTCLAAQRLYSKHFEDRGNYTKMTSYAVMLAGVLAELAASKVYGGKVNQTIFASGDNHEPDLRPAGRQPLEVKGVTWGGPNPLMKIGDDELRDGVGYVLVLVSWPDTFKVYPPVDADFVRARGQRVNFGHGERWTVSAGLIAT